MRAYKFSDGQRAKSFVRKPSYPKEKDTKQKNNKGSTFIKISIKRPFAEEDVKVMFVQGYGLVASTGKKRDEYLLEFDNHANSYPHFHVWRVNGYSKVSDTRSPAIALNSSLNKGLVYSYREHKKEAKLNDIQEQELLMFIEENRMLLFFMYNAFRSGKTKSFNGLDEDYVSSLFSDREICSLMQKYNQMFGESEVKKFGE